MATRYPLIVDTTDDNKIKELPTGDNLNLSGNNIVNAINITATGVLSANSLVLDTTSATFGGQTLNTVAFTGQYNDLAGAPTPFSGSYNDLSDRPVLVTSIEELTNVDDAVPNDNDVLKYSTSLGRYVPQAASAISVASANIQDLNNVTVDAGLATNQVFKWNGSNWLNGNVTFSEITSKPTTLSGYGITDGLSHLHQDTTPELGGDLDTAGFNITFGNNEKAKFGTGGDLEIYHSGSDSFIDDVGTGSLFIRSGTTYFQNADGTKTSIQTNSGAGQTIYFNNSPKLETTANGITVEGSVTSNFIGSVFADDSSQMLDAETQTLYGTIVATAGTAPTVSGQPGAVGEIRFDDNYIYIKTSGAGWKRAALSGLV